VRVRSRETGTVPSLASTRSRWRRRAYAEEDGVARPVLFLHQSPQVLPSVSILVDLKIGAGPDTSHRVHQPSIHRRKFRYCEAIARVFLEYETAIVFKLQYQIVATASVAKFPERFQFPCELLRITSHGQLVTSRPTYRLRLHQLGVETATRTPEYPNALADGSSPSRGRPSACLAAGRDFSTRPRENSPSRRQRVGGAVSPRVRGASSAPASRPSDAGSSLRQRDRTGGRSPRLLSGYRSWYN
jgi:hypothetical protein